MKKTPSANSLIHQLILNIKGHILEGNINNPLNKFRHKEKENSVRALVDLLDMKSKSESEVYEILNTMVKNSQFFIYCGPLLLNINPGPNNIKDYLNLQSWIKETENVEESEWKPHLYSFMYYVYKTLIQEKRDQVVNMLGQIGSGKTFNMIHIIEYFCCMVGPDNKQIDTFDMIHKSIQLVHIMGSIFRQNNLESTSCGILLRLGFGHDNKIANFDIDAKILDCTLPFSENGRSYSILHSFLSAATIELKRNFFLPENEIHLNFFRKFGNNFSKQTKERFKLNDYEIWNRFHSLLKFFGFTKDEVIEILQIFSFLININELGMTKGSIGHTSGFIISKGQCSHRLSILLNMSEDNFIHQMGVFKDVQEIKNTFISLMKYAYYIVFDFIITKIKKKLKMYFYEIYPKVENIKYINFLDFPGEVEDQTLGGLFTNLANECINLYAGNSYSAVVERMLREDINIKLFKPLHSYRVVQALMGQNGLISFLSSPFTEQNFNNFKKSCKAKASFKKCIKFKEDNENQLFKFDFNFSHKRVRYNIQSLFIETKSLINCSKTLKIFSISHNKIIKSTYLKIVPNKIDFFSYTFNTLQTLFKPLDGLSPFVIYCLHSNNSRKLFFGNEDNSVDEKWVIPKKLTQDMLKNSLCIPVLYWHWFGYHEWINIETFLNEFENDFQIIDQFNKAKIKRYALDDKDTKNDVNFKDKSPYEKVNIIINQILLGRNCVIGKTKILFKPGMLVYLRKRFDKLLTNLKSSNKFSRGNSPKDQAKGSKLISSLESYQLKMGLVPKKSFKKKKSLKNQCDLMLIQNKSEDEKDKGNFELINVGDDDSLSKKYNIFNIMDKSKIKTLLTDALSSNEEMENPEEKNKADYKVMNEKELEEFRKKNNIIIPSKNNFEMVNNIFNFNNHTNFKIFDYSKLIPEIIKIQCAFRCFHARQKKLFLKYVFSQINTVQKMVKGMQTRRKFKRLKKCLELILRIQRAFRKRFEFSVKQVIIIQSFIRRLLSKIKYQRKKKRFEESLKGKEEYYDSSDEEQVRRMKDKKKRKELCKKIERHKKLKEELRKGKESERLKKIKEEEENERKKSLKMDQQRKLLLQRREQNKNSKAQARTFYSYFDNIPNETDSQDKFKKEFYDIENEKDIDKVITALLLDKNLMKDNEEMNRLLANENGVKKDVRYKLLQIEKPKTKKNELANYYINNNNKSNKKEKIQRIEDKLIEYGKILKQKKAKERVDKLKEEDEKCTFKPKIRKKKINQDIKKNDFYVRSAQFEERKGKEINDLKNAIVDPDQKEYTFKPKISKNAQKIKRNIKDLYEWDLERQKKLMDKQKEKMKKEEEEFELLQQTTKSKILLTKKSKKDNNNIISENNITSNNNENISNSNNYEYEEEVQFDLWPNYLEKKYIDKNEDIPIPEKNDVFNHLDFIGNKMEFNENRIDYEENEDDD